jgi:sigma-E factor negative regulatory protein RseB
MKRRSIIGILKASAGALLLASSSQLAADGCAAIDSEAMAWLEKMSRSVLEVNYHGVVTLQRGDDMQVVQVSHAVAGDRSEEQLTQLTGKGAKVVRDDHPLDCIHPGQQLLLAGAGLGAGRCGIAEHYRFSVVDGERVAGRQAVRVRIDPLDMYRYGYVMELDRETGLLLKAETVGRGQQRLERFQFASISYDQALPGSADINLTHFALHPHPHEPSGQAGLGRPWSVGWIPRGFTPTDEPATDAGRKSYTDGLAVFSVFLERLGKGIRPGEGVARNGSTLSYTRGMRMAEQSVLVTVIGEVPVNTARMVADSLEWQR